MRDRQTDRRRRLGEQPISRIFPNMVTLAGLCCGLSSIRFALDGRFELAVGFIVAAALIDGMDGRIARMLGATSLFGAQLDSLSDFLCFGVAPVIVIYIWQLHEVRGIGWAVVLFYTVCCALRLARFNTSLLNEARAPWEKQFFTGIPSPAGGGLCLIPLMIFLQSDETLRIPSGILVLYILLIAVLMASRIPTFSGKTRIRHDLILPFMLAFGVVLVLLIIEPWMTLTVIGVIYLALIPFSIRLHSRLKGQSHSTQV